MKKKLFRSIKNADYFTTLTSKIKKVRAVFTLLLLFSFCSRAQVFNGGGGPILNNGWNTYFNLSVSGLVPSQLDSTFGIEQVCINITHTNLQELTVYLQSPSGTMVELTSGSSCSGVNYTNTCFDSQPGTSVTIGTAPYTGTFRPMGYLGRFNTNQAGNGLWKLVVSDYLTSPDSGSVISWSITFGNSPPHPVNFISSNLPLVLINTNNQTLSEADIIADMGIIDNGTTRNYITDPLNNYNNRTTIHVRGSSSKIFEKKSFSLQTENAAGVQLNASLLGMPKEHDWDLVAPYQDKSLIRASITCDLFRQMGHYASRLKNVELVINNEYQGIYTLIEKPKRDSGRINISKLTINDNLFPDVTGGYILKIDRSDVGGWFSLLPGNATATHFYYQYVYPSDSNITTQQKYYIKNALDTFETVLNGPSFADPLIGYQKYIDVNSFIDFFIINELSKNVDAYKLSTYLYKEKSTHGGKIHIGPVWDYDIAWHNCNYGNAFSPMGWQYQIPDTTNPSPAWWGRFLQDNNFADKLNCRWQSLRQNLLSYNYLYGYVDSTVTALNESQQRNFTQWPVLGAYITPNPQVQPGATYAGEITDLKNWIANRVAWMDANMPGICNVEVQENVFSGNSILTFPNPFDNSLNIAYKVSENAYVKIELLNLLGEQVLLHFNGDKKAGTYTETVSTGELAGGIYIVRFSVNNLVFHQKLVKAGQ